MKTNKLKNRIDKSSFSVSSFFENSDEKEYWQTKSSLERLEAVEIFGKEFMATIHLPPDFKEFFQLVLADGV